ncbi:MAG: ABC transporter permease [Caldilineaceae bacterium]|nr:ABC transporter permease [Caldilineaceae bacterium]
MTAINPAYLTLGNFYDILRFMTIDGLLALGVLVVLISGGVDVSFPAIASFATYVAMVLLIGMAYDGPMWGIYLVALPIGLLLGLLNGVIVNTFRLPTLIVTLGTSSLYFGAMLFFFGSRALFNLPASVTAFSRTALHTVPAPNNVGTTALHPSILILLAAALGVGFVLRYTMLGRGIFAVGGSREVAERTGYNIRRIEYVLYSLAGLLAATAGVTYAALNRQANPVGLRGTELDVIAAVVLGGASIMGGSGTVAGALLGVVLLTIIRSSLVLVGIPSEWQRFVVGIILIIGVTAPAVRSLRERRDGIATTEEEGVQP